MPEGMQSLRRGMSGGGGSRTQDRWTPLLESLVPLQKEFMDTGDCTSPWAGGGRGGTQEQKNPRRAAGGELQRYRHCNWWGWVNLSLKLVSSLRLWLMALERNWKKFEAVISRGLWGSRAAATSPWAGWLLGERSPHHGARLIPNASKRELRCARSGPSTKTSPKAKKPPCRGALLAPGPSTLFPGC